MVVSGAVIGSVISLAVLGVGVVPLRMSRRRLALADAVEHTPPVALAEAKPGLCATSGVIEAEGDVHLLSGVTGKKCVYWEVIVDEDNGGDIERLASQRTGVRVKLVDGPAQCAIDFTGARVAHDAPYEEVHDQHDRAEGIRQFLKQKMGFLNRPRSLKQLRFRELSLHVGQRVNVYGLLSTAAGGTLLFSATQGPLFVSPGSTVAATRELRHDAKLLRQGAFTLWAVGMTGLAAFLWQHGLG